MSARLKQDKRDQHQNGIGAQDAQREPRRRFRGDDRQDKGTDQAQQENDTGG